MGYEAYNSRFGMYSSQSWCPLDAKNPRFALNFEFDLDPEDNSRTDICQAENARFSTLLPNAEPDYRHAGRIARHLQYSDPNIASATANG
jgi:hypothetical protein